MLGYVHLSIERRGRATAKQTTGPAERMIAARLLPVESKRERPPSLAAGGALVLPTACRTPNGSTRQRERLPWDATK